MLFIQSIAFIGEAVIFCLVTVYGAD